MKIIQTIYQPMKLVVPIDIPIVSGKTTAFFTTNTLHLVKITGRPQRIDDNGYLLAPDVGLVALHKGIYLVLQTECTDDSDQAVLVARERNNVMAAWLSLFFGKRATEIFLGSNAITNNQFSYISPVLRSPAFYKAVNYDLGQIKNFESHVLGFASLKEEDRMVIELAMRWYMKGRSEEVPIDAYLSYWVCLEVIFGEWKGMVNRIAQILTQIIPGTHTKDEIKVALGIGKLIALRSDIVHKGKDSFRGTFEHDHLILLREISEEILRHRIGAPNRDRFSKYFRGAH